MSRSLPATVVAASLLLVSSFAMSGQQPAQQTKPAGQEEQAPPEEDASSAPKEYSFNPLQATKEIKVGNYYMKRGKYRAAAQRYLEATKWNAQLPEAYLRLGEAEDKLKDPKAAREAYAKYLELAPEDKEAREVKKRVAKL